MPQDLTQEECRRAGELLSGLLSDRYDTAAALAAKAELMASFSIEFVDLLGITIFHPREGAGAIGG